MTRTPHPTVPCRLCNLPTEHTNPTECDACHLAIATLPYLLRSEKGRAYVAGELGMPSPGVLDEARRLLQSASNGYDQGDSHTTTARLLRAALELLNPIRVAEKEKA